MLLIAKHILNVFELLDSPSASGGEVKDYLLSLGAESGWVRVERIEGKRGFTDFISIQIPGKRGKATGGTSKTLGVIGRLGGIGARPGKIGFVSDGDGALTCIASAAKVIDMHKKGDVLAGDVIFATHICPNAPRIPHKPVDFMGAPVDMTVMNQMEVSSEMDAILSIDTTKGNRIINHNGFAISPTVKEGYILRVSEDLLDIMEIVTGSFPKVFALSDQDITPYGNDLYHINSILQPAISTNAPVVGVAITTQTAVPGCATGATSLLSTDMAGRFAIEVAKDFTNGKISFYSEEEFELLIKKYGSRKIMQTKGEE